MKKYLNWKIYELLLAIIGLFLYCLSIKVFIVPNNLYNGGIMGLSQLIRTLITRMSNHTFAIDIATIIYYIVNIPLFCLAYKKMGKTFFYRTLFCVTLSSIFLLIIPELNAPINNDLLTNILVGGVLCGLGTGLAISVGASTGGTDIIGMVLTKKYKIITVGGFNLAVNLVVYGISAIIGGIQTMIYSVLYSVFDSIIVDKLHIRNINSTVMIFTKKNPKVINYYIKDVLRRGFTYWEAKGGYDDSKTYITYVVLSKYEKYLLQNILKMNNVDAFLVESDKVGVVGKFNKYL